MSDLGTKTATSAVARTRVWTIAAWAALGWALFTLAILHIVSSFHPLTDPLSRYAFSDHGGGMLEASLLSFSVGVIAVRGALLAAGITFPRTTSVLIYATALGLVAAALFPATFTPEIDPISGRIHQYGSLIAFLCLPAIAFSLLDKFAEVPQLAATRRMLVRLLQVGLLSLGLFGVSYVVDTLPAMPVVTTLMTLLPVGFTQRLVFVVDFCLLVALLVAAVRTARLHQGELR
ncbi:DUF998 domain-containing protein [Prauserella cavernicola]|uniref:DUF998 domain-containing protein n=1 Tax=Prauserella cavernicola TaxID=2800127 RepID=A0A934QQ04_9PSEU|nr:DUF998 domain-containing protein [Prauserella cavernicola]MBK1784260.1 DUF998 domain-containing protein [Prauserella cavernicola]